MLPGAFPEGFTVIPGSTSGGAIVPRCRDK
jgi:hypothetical protein